MATSQSQADTSRQESPGPRPADGRQSGITLQVPDFDIRITVPYVPESSLQYYMEKAADEDPRFGFTVEYFGQWLGFSLRAVNQRWADYDADRTVWCIVDSEGKSPPFGLSNYKPKDGETIQLKFHKCKEPSRCGDSASKKRYGVTLHAINSLQEPNFDIEITLPLKKGSNLLSYLERAQEEDERFRFSASYHGESLGYYVDVLNKVKADYDNDGTWWRLGYSATPGPTLGPSFYVPVDCEEIQFTLTKGPKSPDNFRPRPGVTLRVINSVREPHFDFHTSQPYVAGTTLRSYLERAAEDNRKFRFTATYDGETEEYSLVGINKLNADTNTSWKLADAEGRPLKVGMSKHLPKDGETVQLIFTEG